MYRRFLLPAVGVGLVLWLGLGSWWYSANYCGLYAGAGIPGLSLMDGSHEISSSSETFSFIKSSADLNVPDGTLTAFQSLAGYLNKEEEKQLKLYGIYSPAETNHSNFENLGLARAEAIRDQLMTLGVPSEKMTTRGIRFENASFAEGVMYGGVYFNFVNVNGKPRLESETKDTSPKDLFQPVNISFDVNEFDIILTEDLEAYLEQVKIFLRDRPSAQIAIIGHADKVGNEKANLSLSEIRARNVKKFMIRSGFDAKRLVIEYKGENDPLSAASNNNLNSRRVELRLRHR